MPPTDNTPDFDSMSPEELMAWMETLAERQGAHEGFTTDKRVDIDEVDPDTVQDSGPGYIPYGMTEEQWAQKQAEEEAKKAERRAAQQQQAPPPQPAAPPVPEPTPEPATPAPAAAGGGDAPDFDSMSPEELMAWMETLAERQGAHEGFTTDKRVDIAEVDPDSVQDSGPGYIPYGMTEEQWAQKQAEEEAKKAERRAAQQQQAPPPAPTPAPTPEPAAPAQPEFELPDLDDLSPTEEITPTTLETESEGLGWLEDLAADTSGDDFPQMDLSGLGDDIGGGLDLSALEDEDASEETDPMSWLDNLAQGGEETPQFDMSFADSDDDGDDEEEAVSAFSSSSEDPMNWLESLAREQGANPEEFTTEADLNIEGGSAPMPEFNLTTDADADIDLPDDIDALDEVDMADEADPVAWLEGLASSQSDGPRGFDTVDEDEDDTVDLSAKGEKSPFADDPLVQSAKGDNVMEALSQGNVSPDDMRGWMDNLLSQGVQRTDDQGFQIPEEEDDDDSMPVADIPDWLVDQVGPPPETIKNEPKQEPPAFVETISEPEVVQDIPDWLKDEVADQQDEGLADIFSQDAAEEETVFAVETDSEYGDESNIDTSDPWVEAFEMERTGQTPEFITDAFDEDAPAIELQEASLPAEDSLPTGDLVPLPGWINEADFEVTAVPATSTPQPQVTSTPPVMDEVEEEAIIEPGELPDWLREMDTQDEMEAVVNEDLPDWLKEAGVSDTNNVPDWLKDTITHDELEAVQQNIPADLFEPQTTPPVSEPAPQPKAQPPREVVPSAASPAPVTVSMSAEEAGKALESARAKLNDGDTDSALEDYEAVIRANVQLDAVVADLRKVVGSQKQNAAAHRILGDGLMRQGQLQEALDTYRKALNLL